MAEISTLARPYAKAIFDLAKEADATDVWSDQLAVLANVLGNDQVQSYLDKPGHTAEARAQWLIELVGDQLGESAKNLLRLLSINDRLAVAPMIAELYEGLRAEDENSIDVEVSSSEVITDEYAAKLTGILQTKFGKDIRLHRTIDPKLKGGAIIRAGDTVIDGSVHGRLERLAQELRN